MAPESEVKVMRGRYTVKTRWSVNGLVSGLGLGLGSVLWLELGSGSGSWLGLGLG